MFIFCNYKLINLFVNNFEKGGARALISLLARPWQILKLTARHKKKNEVRCIMPFFHRTMKIL